MTDTCGRAARVRRLAAAALLALMLPGVAGATYRPGYYDAMEGKRRETLKAAAKACVQSHTRLDYYNLPTNWQYSDVYPGKYDGRTRWWEMYSDQPYYITAGESARSSFSRNRMQREHAVPKSWWKRDGSVEYTPAYTDMWNLYPSDAAANQAKSNYAYGPVSRAVFDNGVTKVGPAAVGYGGGSGQLFEPADEYKGDFARTIFYMATVYDDLPWTYKYMFAGGTWPTLQPWAYNMLLQWARFDPVSQKEIDRNNAVERQQGNRNPYIDFPELAEYIWGTRTSEVFRIADQEGASPTPPITGEAELTLPVNYEAVDFAEVAVGQTVSSTVRVMGSNLTEALTVRISGRDRDCFGVSATQISAAAVNSGEAYLLEVTYSPRELGEHQAVLAIYDGGLAIGKDVAVNLIGRALPRPGLTALTALPPSDISDYSYTANWSAAPETVDYYVVTRVRYVPGDVQSTTVDSDVNSCPMEGREPDVAESYTVQSSRLGFLSDPSNSVMVATGSVAGVETSQPLVLGSVPGGFCVPLGMSATSLRVCDTRGVTVLLLDEVSGGEEVPLPPGVYIVTAAGALRPVKIAVGSGTY